MAKLVVLVGCPGSGKSTYCGKNLQGYTRVSQDDQGPKGHKIAFEEALSRNEDIVIDRQNNIRFQRDYYLKAAKDKGYSTKIVWFKVDKELCEKRILERTGHPTIDDKTDVRMIVKTYERNLEAPSPSEADEVEEIYVPFYAPIQDLTHLRGRIGVFGDLHGVWEETKKAIDELRLDYYVFLGDLNDRGPDLIKILEFIRSNPGRAFVLEGNHEHKLKRWLKGNRVSVAASLQITVDSLAVYNADQKRDLYHWIMALPAIIKLPMNYVGVHAGFDPTKPLSLQKYATCLWIRTYGGKKFDDKDQPLWFKHEMHEDLKAQTILFGHNVLDEIYVAPNVRALDGGAVYGQDLRVCVIDTNTQKEEIVSYKCKKYFDKSKEDASFVFSKRDALVHAGYLGKSELEDLVLYNYTDKCTFERSWSKLTLGARGTIYNKKTGEVVAKTFDKFFNLNETEDTQFGNLPMHLGYQVFEKLDGSLGNLYKNNDKYAVATRGSFYSDQAKKATQMLDKYNLTNVPKNVSLTFEIIYPENEIIVPYGDREGLTVIGGFNNKTGEELPWDKVVKIAKQAGFPVAATYNYTIEEIQELAKTMPHTFEGWVVRFENGLRVKVKVHEYLQMAKILAHVSPLAVWEALCEGKMEDYLVQIPEEIRAEVEGYRDVLVDQNAKIKHFISKEADRLGLDKYPIPLKKIVQLDLRTALTKEAALIVNEKSNPKWRGVLFMYLNGQDSTNTIYKMLRPTENKFADLDKILGV